MVNNRGRERTHDRFASFARCSFLRVKLSLAVFRSWELVDSVGGCKPCKRILVGIDTNQGTPAQPIQLPLYDRMGSISISGLLIIIVRLQKLRIIVGAYAGSLVHVLVKVRKADARWTMSDR